VGTTLEDEIAAPFRRRRARALDVLAEQNTIGLVPADGAMYLMLDIRATGLTGEGFANALLDKHAIAVMPGESFGTAAAGHVRVAMTVDDDRFETALKTICAFASEMAGQQAAE
jgi:arginine:pyruvate transaminase